MSPTLHRRTLVAAAGATGAAAALTAAGTLPAAATTLVRVGVLTTGGSSFAGAGRSLVDGLSTGALASGLFLAPEVRELTYGLADDGTALADLASGGAQVIVAAVGGHAIEQLAPACAEAGLGLIGANVGAHVVTAGEPSGLVVQNSLQHWQSALVMGGWAARHLGKRLFVIAAAPDAGYDTVFAVRRGCTSAGGRVVGLALTHGSEGDRVAQAAAATRRSGADVVAVCASGVRAAAIVRALRHAHVRAEIVCDSLALEDFARDAMGTAARGVWSTASWSHELDTPANHAFVRSFRSTHRRAPDAFAALGHDTALLLAAAQRRLPGGDWSRVGEALAGRTVHGARGAMRVHPTLGSISSPLRIRQVRTRASRQRNVVVATHPAVRGVAPALAALQSREVAAYFNEYLAT